MIAEVAVAAAAGALAGWLSAFFGVGGGWLVTPVLLLGGQPAPRAVGTTLALISGVGLAGAIEHRALRRSPLGVVGPMALGMMVGVEAGRSSLIALDAAGQSADGVTVALALVLAAVGFAWLRPERGSRQSPGIPLPRSALGAGAIWLAAGVGVGVISGFAGIGGGVIIVPLLVSAAGLDHRAAVGASLVVVVVAAAWGGLRYASAGQVDGVAVAAMLPTAWLGAKAGTTACRAVARARFRRLFAAQMLGAAALLWAGRAGWRGAALGGILALAGGLTAAIAVEWLRARRSPPSAAA